MLLQIKTETKCDCAPLSPVASRHGPVTVTSPRVQTAWGLGLAVSRVRFEGGSVRRLRRVMCRPPHDFLGPNFPPESVRQGACPSALRGAQSIRDRGSTHRPSARRSGTSVTAPALLR